MPERINFNKTTLKALEPPASGRKYLYDTQVPNLCLCITSSGSMTWYRYGRVKGKPQRYRIGRVKDFTADQARTECRRLNGEVAARIDPMESKRTRSEEKTLRDAFAWFLEHRSKAQRKAWKKDQADYDNHLKHWENRRLSTLLPAEIQEHHQKTKAKAGPWAANQSCKLLRRIYKTAIENGWAMTNPAAAVVLAETPSRERFLNMEELVRWFAALNAVKSESTRDFFLMALYTGARRDNVASMRWDEIDMEKAIWTIPGQKFKTKTSMMVVLAPQSIEILNRRANDSEWVFPSYGKTGHFVEPKHAWKKICVAAEIKDLRLHDLRRTLGSWQAGLGASLPIIGKSLGHKSQSATQIYARLDIEPVRASVLAAVNAIEAAKKIPKK